MKYFLTKLKDGLFKRYRRSKFYFPTMKKLYTLMRYLLPVDKKLVVFESNVAKSIGDSPKALYDKLQELDTTYKYVWIYNGSDVIQTANTKTVIRFGLKYYYYLARAGYWVNNQNFPTYLIKSKGTTYLQTWHGTPLKKMQNDLEVIIGRNATYLERVNFAVSQWDYLISPSEYATTHFRTAFNFDKEVLELGYPRNDLFYQSEATLAQLASEVKIALGLKREYRKIILYAPTFRDDAINNFDLELDLELFNQELSDEYLLLVRGHTATGQKINIPDKYIGDILNVSAYPNIQELYLITDICITDYSSVMFDFAHTKKPMLFFTYDLEHYKDNLRGFYMDFIAEAPGELSKTTDELINDIRNVSFNELSTKYEAFYHKYCYLEDGRSSEKIIEKVFGLDFAAHKKISVANQTIQLIDQDLKMSQETTGFAFSFTNFTEPLVLSQGEHEIVLEASAGQYHLDAKILRQIFPEATGMTIISTKGLSQLFIKSFIDTALLSLKLNADQYYLYGDRERRLVLSKNVIPDFSAYYLKHRVLATELNQTQVTFEYEVITMSLQDVVVKTLLKQPLSKDDTLLEAALLATETLGDGVYKHKLLTVIPMSAIYSLYEANGTMLNEIFELQLGFSLFDEKTGLEITRETFWFEQESAFTQKKIVDDVYELYSFEPDGEGRVSFKACRVSIDFYDTQISNQSLNYKGYEPELAELDEVELFFFKLNFWGLTQVRPKIIRASVLDKQFMINLTSKEEELYLTNSKEKVPLEKTATNGYRLSVKEIEQMIGGAKSIALVDQDDFPIVLNQQRQLEATNQLEIKTLRNNYYLYKNVNNELRVSKNAVPSYKSYYLNHSTDKVEAHGASFILSITVRTLFFELEKVVGRVKLRGQEEVSDVEGEIVTSEKRKNGIVVTKVRLKFSTRDILSVANNLESRMYNYDIFDFLFYFEFANQPTDSSLMNLKFGDLLEDTLHLTSDDSMVLYFYPTLIGEKLAAKMTLIDEDAYAYYEQQVAEIAIKGRTKNTKPVVLVSEYPHKAQDTGLAFFKYLVEHHLAEIEPYYVISDISKDSHNLKGYEENVVTYKSTEHIRVFLAADIIVGSHGTNYAGPVVDSKTKELLAQKFKVFLQHGILGVRDMTHLYGKKEESPFTNLFITSSERERKMVIEEFGYAPNEVILSGLPRFDKLFSTNFNHEKSLNSILIMPSWREGLERKTPSQFKNSLFYRAFDDLITNEEFKAFTKKYNVKVKFYLHTNFQKFTSCFTSDFVEIVSEGTKTVQEYLIENDCLITDYSSVGLDFALMEKPIIYYQFDNSIKNARGELNYNFFPGEIKRTVKEIQAELDYLAENPGMRKAHFAKLDNLYLYRDTNANQRIYEAMMREFEKKKI